MRRATLLVLLAVLLAFPTAAQNTDIEALSGLQFSFGNPGARALGMGGAFLGLADDASAAEANPAGLTILRKTEVSIETRNVNTTQSFVVGGTFPDQLERNDFTTYGEGVPVAFASVVTPIGDNLALAAYFHSPIDFETTITNTLFQEDAFGNRFFDPVRFFLGPQGPISEEECFGSQFDDCLIFDLLPRAVAIDIRLQTYGVAAAWSGGKLSVGVAGRYQTLEQRALSLTTDFDLVPLFATEQVADDEDFTVSAGFKYAFSNRISVGGVYKQGAEFETEIINHELSSGDAFSVGSPTFHVPDVYGLGLSVRPIQDLTINADALLVTHSNATNEFVSTIFGDSEGARAFASKDVTEIHLGVEYAFSRARIPFLVRLGWWRDPAHAITYENTGVLFEPGQVFARILYPGSEDQDHVTGGFGLAWPNFQIDVAYDTSDVYKVGSLSAVYRF